MSTPEELAQAQYGQSTFNTMYTSQVQVPQPVMTSYVQQPAVVNVREVVHEPVVRTSVRAPVVVQQPQMYEQVVTQQIVVPPPPPPPAPVARRNSMGATTLGGGNPYGLASANRGMSGYNAINNALSRNTGQIDPKTSLTALNLGDVDGFTANQFAPPGGVMRQNVPVVQNSGYGPGPAGPLYAQGANPRGFNSVSSFVNGTQAPGGYVTRPY